MKPRASPLRLWPLALLLFTAVTINAAFVAGGTAYTKRRETKLLSEPRPLADVAG